MFTAMFYAKLPGGRRRVHVANLLADDAIAEEIERLLDCDFTDLRIKIVPLGEQSLPLGGIGGRPLRFILQLDQNGKWVEMNFGEDVRQVAEAMRCDPALKDRLEAE